LIRLLRSELGEAQYKHENKAYRDINRDLSEVRDNAALTEILDKLSERFSDELNHDAFVSFRRELVSSKRARLSDKKRVLAQARKSIVTVRKRVKKWSIENDGFPAIGLGLTEIYANGRKGFDKAYRKNSVRAFHEWRKDVKYLWYQVKLLHELWPGLLKDYA